MIWNIVKRELLDHLMSLRFALTTLILVALMITNAVVHLQTYPKKVRRYSELVTASDNMLGSRTQLYELLQNGPGTLYKRPSSLSFIAAGGDSFLPLKVENNTTWQKSVMGRPLESIWSMSYPRANMGAINTLRPTAAMIDWAFVITYLLSFIPILFTFDAIAAEKEQGTLRLCFANAISRPAVLAGKFLGAFIALLVPFYFAVLCNLVIISTDSWTQLSGADFSRLGLVVLIASGYASIFIAVGLLVSAGARDHRLSLVLLLLIWVTVVVFTPSTLGIVAAKWMPPVKTRHQFEMAKTEALKDNETVFERQVQPSLENILDRLRTLSITSPEAAEQLAIQELERTGNSYEAILQQHVIQDREIRERLNRQHLAAQSAQVAFARQVTRCSPAASVQYAIESLAGTGFNRHLQFLADVFLYLQQFRGFVSEMDRADPESLHLIGIPQGMSKKPISPGAVPKFEDTIRFQDTLNRALLDIFLLFLFICICLFGAFVVFLRTEI